MKKVTYNVLQRKRDNKKGTTSQPPHNAILKTRYPNKKTKKCV